MVLYLFLLRLIEIAIMVALKPFPILQRRRSRPSFTLVELMVVVAVIGIMSGMLLYALAGAQRDALVARTQGTLKKINDIVLYKWEEFRYRSVKVNIPEDYMYRLTTGPQAGQAPVSPREAARLRLMVLRDTMRMELPDQYLDLEYSPSYYQAAVFTDSGTPSVINPPIVRTVPGEYNNLRRSFGLPPVVTPYYGPVTAGASVSNQGTYDSAELLYQIVASANYNGSNGLEYFRPTEIGDFDEDGRPEFLDAWGTPICFIRWPSGYGEPNRSLAGIPRPADSILNDTTVPDAMDPLRTDWRWGTNIKPWLLVPLIVSAGADRDFNLWFDTGINYALTTAVGAPAGYPSPYLFPDPYAPVVKVINGQNYTVNQGQLMDPNSTADADNITNYSLLLQ